MDTSVTEASLFMQITDICTVSIFPKLAIVAKQRMEDNLKFWFCQMWLAFSLVA